MTITTTAQALRTVNWDRVRTADFYMKSGSRLRVRPRRGQKLAYTTEGDAICCQDDDPSTWFVPVEQVEAAFISINTEEEAK